MVKKKSNQELLAESFKELLTFKPFEKITVKNIVDNCQLTRGTFYHYFKDKYELMNWIYSNKINDFLKNNPDISSWKELLSVVTHFLESDRAFFSSILEFRGQNSFEEFLYSYGYSYCVRSIKQCTGKEKISEEDDIAVTVYIGGTMKALFTWIQQGCRESAEMVAKIMSECMPHPLEKYFKSDL